MQTTNLSHRSAFFFARTEWLDGSPIVAQDNSSYHPSSLSVSLLLQCDTSVFPSSSSYSISQASKPVSTGLYMPLSTPSLIPKSSPQNGVSSSLGSGVLFSFGRIRAYVASVLIKRLAMSILWAFLLTRFRDDLNTDPLMVAYDCGLGG